MNFLKRYRQTLIAIAFWATLLVLGIQYLRSHEMGVVDGLMQIIMTLQENWYGPVIYIVLYTLRPLTFFSATITTILAGSLFGPIGIAWAVIGSNLSALLTYIIGHLFGQEIINEEKGLGFLKKYVDRLRINSFETVMVLRLLYAPYDLVGYLAGFLKIGWRSFLVATILSALPGTIALVLFGSTLPAEMVLAGEIPPFNPWILAASVMLFVLGIGISRFMRRREAMGQESSAPSLNRSMSKAAAD